MSERWTKTLPWAAVVVLALLQVATLLQRRESSDPTAARLDDGRLEEVDRRLDALEDGLHSRLDRPEADPRAAVEPGGQNSREAGRTALPDLSRRGLGERIARLEELVGDPQERADSRRVMRALTDAITRGDMLEMRRLPGGSWA